MNNREKIEFSWKKVNKYVVGFAKNYLPLQL